MAHTLKGLIAGLTLVLAHTAFGQDSTALINTTWQFTCSDTTLTYAQMVATCDSMFFAAGYPVYADTASQSDTLQPVSSSGNDTGSVSDTTGDESPFFDYLRWKAFWVTRLDEATGKLHNFAADPYDTSFASGERRSGGRTTATDDCGYGAKARTGRRISVLVEGSPFVRPCRSVPLPNNNN